MGLQPWGLELLIWLSEHIKPYKGPFLGAGIVSLITFLLTIFLNLNPYPSVLIPFVIAILLLFCWVLTTEKLYQKLAKSLTRSRFKNPNWSEPLLVYNWLSNTTI